MALTKAQERQKQKQIEYWTKREEEAIKRRITEEKAYERELQKIYDNMLDNIQKEIDAFYGKYAKQNGITLAEAKKAVSELDIKAYERKAKRYVRDKDFSAEANEEMRLYNLTMKINRLEMLKANIGLELISGHDELQKFMEGVLQGRTMEELERQAGILGKTVRNNAQTANAIVNASFHNAKFSDRIWMHQDLLKSDLNKLLQSGLIAGKNPRVLAREIKSRFGVKIADAERLMRTELARVQTEAQKQSFEANGFTQYIFLALGDACDICKDIDENHYNVEDMKPGTNAPPLHPFCRCSTAAYESSEEYEEWLEALSKGETTEAYNKRKLGGKSKGKGKKTPLLEHEKAGIDYRAEKVTFKDLSKWRKSIGQVTDEEYEIIGGMNETSYVKNRKAYEINEAMRNGTVNKLSEKVQTTIETLKNVISRNKSVDDAVLIRKVDRDYIKNVFNVDAKNMNDVVEKLNAQKLGESYTEKAFISTSYKASKNLNKNDEVEIEIFAPKGTKMFLPRNRDESEIILAPNTDLELEGAVMTEEGRIRLIMKVKKQR